MKSVKIYTWKTCPYCIRAIQLLKTKKVDFEEFVLDGKDDELNALRAKTGHKTVPQIFIGDEFIGGYSELAALESTGELSLMLRS